MKQLQPNTLSNRTIYYEPRTAEKSRKILETYGLRSDGVLARRSDGGILTDDEIISVAAYVCRIQILSGVNLDDLIKNYSEYSDIAQMFVLFGVTGELS